MRNLAFTVALFLFTTTVKASSTDTLKCFNGNLIQALQQSSHENMPLMIVFSTSWCGYCKKIKQTALADKEIISFINENYIFLDQNCESAEGKKLVSDYGITSYPTIIFMKSDGKPLLTSEGYHEKDDLMQLMKSVQDIIH